MLLQGRKTVTSATLYWLTYFVDNGGWENFTERECERAVFACVIQQEKRILKSTYSVSLLNAVYFNFWVNKCAVSFSQLKFHCLSHTKRCASSQKAINAEHQWKFIRFWCIHFVLSNVIRKQELVRNSVNVVWPWPVCYLEQEKKF